MLLLKAERVENTVNEAIKTVMTRRSVRKFLEKPISKEDLTTIVDAARHAPSARNRQLWQFTVVQNAEVLARLAKAVGTALGDANYNFYRPNALIITSAERDFPFGTYDCACALENMFITAHALGIGSVWINQLQATCNDIFVRAILTEIGIPESHIAHGCAALGYAAAPSPERVVKPVEETVKWVM